MGTSTDRRARILAIDQGTTSVRATLLDASLAPIATHAESVPRSFPKPGWVELDAEEVVAATERVAAAAIKAAEGAPIAGVGLANQGETVVVWERASGKPIGPAVVWQCRRTEELCEGLRKDEATAAWVREATGLPMDPYFSATKLAWLLDEIPGARGRAERGELVAGTLDTFTLFRLSGGRVFVTDPSTSCRTLLAPLASGRWDARLCELFRVPLGMLAEVVSSDAEAGSISIGGASMPVRALLCDQPSALLGTGCLSPGDAKCTYGTGAFLQANTGGAPAASSGDDGLLRSIAWELGGARTYLCEGSVLAAGDVLTWLRDDLGLLNRPEEVEEILRSTPSSEGVLFVPALGGLGAPRWAGGARGTLLGLHRGSRREHVVRAALEGIAHQVADILDVAARALPSGLRPMWADGGLALSPAFLELQADLAGSSLR
ncbi:MAG TPA: FGGY family carbohydrate kinase, partial [Polyangiaceae bacterium]|nr:FGGY family carbohydrate kinase [Polyangiaceae bacterium]